MIFVFWKSRTGSVFKHTSDILLTSQVFDFQCYKRHSNYIINSTRMEKVFFFIDLYLWKVKDMTGSPKRIGLVPFKGTTESKLALTGSYSIISSSRNPFTITFLTHSHSLSSSADCWSSQLELARTQLFSL